ncbi:DegT/DnrJ/EryC1/StrS family aminotransferase [Pleionea sediminis]|uniref:DegT/DnrJ/EryC1/StrS family aminotransferase n=1 Tax=Pleionea sediminis TaxID=2569479 RepID=UPI001185A25E|nr:DegT/DnrJ/EryC1/StrS family aminotransferase [Pleionea sediminis]
MFCELTPVGDSLRVTKGQFQCDVFHPFDVFGFDSGTSALAAAIIAVKESAQQIAEPEVIVPGYTCPDVLSACQFAGVKVKLIDFEENLPFINLSKLLDTVNSSTIAVIAINFLGIPERIIDIKRTLSKTNVVVIEDSAQGMPLGNVDNYWKGDLVTLSFGRGKPLGLLGGGAVLKSKSSKFEVENSNVVNESALAKTKYLLKRSIIKVLSIPAFYFWVTKLPFLKLGETKYKKLIEINPLSEIIASRLSSAIVGYQSLDDHQDELHKMISQHKDKGLIDFYSLIPSDIGHVIRYPVLLPSEQKRDELYTELQSKGLGASKMYQKSLIEFSDIPNDLILGESDLENAKSFARRLITLACHNGVTKRHLDAMNHCISQVF